MADLEQGGSLSANEPSSRDQNASGRLRRKMPDVNFDDMNFEQRRAPYNSGNRNIGDRAYDKDRDEERTGRRRDDR